MTIAFIGGGNMASAMIGGLLAKGYAAAGLRVVEIAADARERLARDFGVVATADTADGVRGATCVVLAVKPQQMREVAAAVRPYAGDKLVITIAAGIRTTDLARWLGGHTRIVRVMPNTPALVHSGVAGLYAMPSTGAEDRARAAQILGAVGTTLWLDREEQLDAVTAVSGSGPAYVFYFIEAMQAAAVELGFTPAQARQLSLETVAGAAKLAQQSPEDAAVLRARVTSKGGTTERALGVLEGHSVRQAIVQAVHAANIRSIELGEALGKQ